MDNPGEILRLCRLCLVKDQVNIPIFEEQGDIRQIFLKISSCLPVKVSLEDKLPKKICDGCSNKLDLLYEFWNTSANAEKTLLSWLGQAGVKDADETISAVAQQIAKPAETQVKQEALDDGHAANQVQDNFGVQSFEEEAKDESEAPPPKRARRTAAVKAQINLTPESDDDDDMDSAEAMTKVEDESDESDGEDKDPSYGEIPGTSADDQAGPSGVGKDGVEAPSINPPVDPVIVLSDDNDDDRSEDFKSNIDSDEEYDRRYSSDDDVIHVESDIRPIQPTESIPEDEINIKGKKLIKQLYCNKCGDRFNDFEKLHRHIFNPSAKNHVFSCENCNLKVGFSVAQLSEHNKIFCRKVIEKCDDNSAETPANKFKYYCERCGNFFKAYKRLVEHYKNHVNELICCSICPIRTTSFEKIMSHFKSHTIVNNIELICKHCEMRFFALHPYQLHHYLVHSIFTNIRYKCILCPQVFTNDKEFLWHVQGHSKIVLKAHMDPERPDKNVSYLTCEICAQIFESAADCKQHKEACHDIDLLREANKTCSICSKSFKVLEMPSHMLEHPEVEPTQLPQNVQQKKSKGNTKVKCYTCKEMVLLATIEAHRESHKFKCDICTRSFNTQQGLKHHFIQHETREHQLESTEQNSQTEMQHVWEQPARPGEEIFRNDNTMDIIQQQILKHAWKQQPELIEQIYQVNKSPDFLYQRLQHKSIQQPTSAENTYQLEKSVGNTLVSSKQYKSKYRKEDQPNPLENISQIEKPMTALLPPIQSKCKVCDRSFMSLNALKEHMKCHSTDAASLLEPELAFKASPKFSPSTSYNPKDLQRDDRSLSKRQSQSPMGRTVSFGQQSLDTQAPRERNFNKAHGPYHSEQNATLFSRRLDDKKAFLEDSVPENHPASVMLRSTEGYRFTPGFDRRDAPSRSNTDYKVSSVNRSSFGKSNFRR